MKRYMRLCEVQAAQGLVLMKQRLLAAAALLTLSHYVIHKKDLKIQKRKQKKILPDFDTLLKRQVKGRKRKNHKKKNIE